MARERQAKERALERETLDALNREPGVLAVKYDPTAGYAPGIGRLRQSKFVLSGVSDILLWKAPGKFMAIELKIPEERESTSLAQKGFMFRMHKLGHRAEVATTVDEAITLVRKL